MGGPSRPRSGACRTTADLLIITDDGSWKTKRIANTPRVTIQESGALGKPKGEPVEGVARVLPKSETRRVYDAVVKRYWWHAWWFIAHTLYAGGSTRCTWPSKSGRPGDVTGGCGTRPAPVRWYLHGDAAVPLYVIVELAVVVALASTIGFGWTVLLVVGTFLAGLVLAGSQVRRQLARLQRGLNDPAGPKGAVTDGALVALGTVLVFIPGLVTTVAGLLMLLPPTRAAVRPLAGALAARGLARRVAVHQRRGTGQRSARGPTGRAAATTSTVR